MASPPPFTPLPRYVLLPTRGLQSPELGAVAAGADGGFQRAIAVRRKLQPVGGARPRKPDVHILHSLGELGPKLAEMGSEAALALRISHPGIKAVPLVYYRPARQAQLRVTRRPTLTAAAASVGLKLRVVDAATQQPLKGAQVVAFTDLEAGLGAQGRANAKGELTLKFGASRKKVELLVVYGPAGYWGLHRRKLMLRTGRSLGLQAIDLRTPDHVASLYGRRPAKAGTGVKVGVIDTGVDAGHPDLRVAAGAVFVISEGDAGDPGPARKDGEHGTHVAGIIASQGRPPGGKRGIAPGVTLHAYRVFPHSGEGATNYDILRAIERGVRDGCDLLNLSLGGDEPDEAVREGIKDAFDQGTVCIVAAGNDGRRPVAYPARWPEVVAVSAAGRIGSYPAHSTETLDEMGPFARQDPQVYIAAFSNVGPEIDLTGPGVGIVSTLPGGRYGVMSGTSMACPAVTGVVAAMLASHPEILALPRARERSIAILGLINQAARPLGFTKELEGLGLLP